jgi:cholest-4-en-3-one 26-monooxygenase
MITRQDDIDLTTPSFFAEGDPDGLWARMRAEDPVHWTEGRLSRGFWSITKYAHAKQIYSGDNGLFSIQEQGNVLPPHPDFEDPANAEALRLTREGASLSAMDGAPHSALRQAFIQKFTLPSIAKLEHLIQDVTTEIMDEVLPRGECDFAVDVAAKLPIMVIAEIMGIPRSDWDDMYAWNNMFASPDDPEFAVGSPLETAQYSLQKINGYCLGLALERRKNPGDDLISLMARAEVDGRALSDEQLGYNGLMFFAAGHETTRNTLCAGLYELVKQPREFARLRELRTNRQALKTAIEEFVRWATPLNHQMRTAMDDTMLGDRNIKKGDLVVVWNVSANRDEDQFKDADRFDCTRSPNAHLGFGFGKHFCLGAHLARLEMLVMLEHLLTSMHDVEVTAEPQRAASNLFRGVKHLPIRFRAEGRLGSRELQ